MNKEVFKLYVDFINDKKVQEASNGFLAERVVDNHFHGTRANKNRRRGFRQSQEFLNDLKAMMADELLTCESAELDEEIIRRYYELEPTAIELFQDGAKNLNFDDLESTRSELEEEKIRKDLKREIQAINLNQIIADTLPDILEDAEEQMTQHFMQDELEYVENDDWEHFFEENSWGSHFNRAPEKYELCQGNLYDYLQGVNANFFYYAAYVLDECYTGDYYRNAVLEREPGLKDLIERCDEHRMDWEIENKISELSFDKNFQFLNDLKERFSIERIEALVANNRLYKHLFPKNFRPMRSRADVLDNIVKTMPDSLENLYPATRQMHRKFILHIGPTNSGKTYEAMQEMRKIGSGIYLAPLRLLAYEQYERMNADGFPCSMITGEETLVVDGALFTASTIEMVSLNKHYACAVIDEAQMINDRDRGGSWTEAILGIPADVVHVCMAPEAKTAIIKLIDLCGDEYEIVEHERRVPLERENTAFTFPSSVQKHDALIVFSRKSVHAVASALSRKGIKCSIIYGSLPYDVRHEEARKFAEGETDVVVATDAIGMGLNLPIKRVVFLEQSKFDGVQSRPLNSTEVKQIAGRAGRYGVFDQGFYTAEFDLKGLRKKYNAEIVPINTISVSFPEALIGIDGPLSTIIEQWNEIKLQPGFVKESTDDLLALTREIESQTDDKMLIYDLASIPVDLKNEDQHDLWLSIAKRVIKNKNLKILDELRAIDNEGEVADDLFGLEQASKKCDILFNFDRKFLNSENNQKISEVRSKISKKIMALLGEKKLEPKRCKYCGKILPWNYSYGMCEECHNLWPREPTNLFVGRNRPRKQNS